MSSSKQSGSSLGFILGQPVFYCLEKVFFADNLSSNDMIYCGLNVTYYDSIFQFDIFNQTC